MADSVSAQAQPATIWKTQGCRYGVALIVVFPGIGYAMCIPWHRSLVMPGL